jgi:hypothetical protein
LLAVAKAPLLTAIEGNLYSPRIVGFDSFPFMAKNLKMPAANTH